MKKILLCLLLLTTLFGCGEKEQVYDYTFTDYIDLQVLGPNGFGRTYLDVKDFDATNFKTEQDFIEVKKIMPEILKNIYVSKSAQIANGDEIEIGIKPEYIYPGELNMNLNPVKIAVNGLKEPKKLDCFSPENVVFYGLEGTDRVYHYYPSSTIFDEDEQEYLQYKTKIDEEEVHQNKTIISAEVKLDESFIKEFDHLKTTEDYFVNKGYLPLTKSEFILKEVITANDLESLSKDKIKPLLKNKIEGEYEEINGYHYQDLAYVFKDTENPYRYYIVAAYLKNDNLSYVRFRTDMIYVNGEIRFFDVTREGTYDPEQGIKDTQELFDFEYDFQEEPKEETDNEVEEKETNESEGSMDN